MDAFPRFSEVLVDCCNILKIKICNGTQGFIFGKVVKGTQLKYFRSYLVCAESSINL